MFAVDTNVLLDAVDESSPHHRSCKTLLETWRSERRPCYLTWGIIYEFLRVSTHPKVFQEPLSSGQAWDFVNVLLESPGCGLLLPGPDHAAQVVDRIPRVAPLHGNLFHDLHTAVLMREHGLRSIYTNDMDFHRFSWIEVINPLAEGG